MRGFVVEWTNEHGGAFGTPTSPRGDFMLFHNSIYSFCREWCKYRCKTNSYHPNRKIQIRSNAALLWVSITYKINRIFCTSVKRWNNKYKIPSQMEVAPRYKLLMLFILFILFKLLYTADETVAFMSIYILLWPLEHLWC